MINIVNATTIALTKLRTRKVRTIVTIITASLMFSTLVLAVTVTDGFIQSARDFTSKGLSDRYIVTVQDYNFGSTPETPELRAQAERIYTQTVAAKKAEAKKLGIEYDSGSEQRPVIGSGNDAQLDYSSPSVTQAIAEQQAQQPTALDNAKKMAEKYHPKAFYSALASVIPGTLRAMPGGKEDFTNLTPVNQNYGQVADVSAGWTYLDASIVKPFLLDAESLAAQKKSNDIPVIAPYSKVETALGLKPLPRKATPAEQLERIQFIRASAASVTFNACYRNQASFAQIEQAMHAAKEVEKNKGNKDYQKPTLIYGVPAADSCAPATVLSDTRTATEKQYVAKQQQFDRTFGEVVDPVQQKLTFRVVGLSPNAMTSENFSGVGALISSVAGSSLQGSWVVPQDMFDTLPDKAAYSTFYHAGDTPATTRTFSGMMSIGPLVEFSTAADAKAFVDTEGCSGYDCSSKPSISYFGSNSVLINSIAAGTTKVLKIVGMIVGGLAALILMGMVGRVVADSRRETAVFRAIGATRWDIRIIYAIYTILLSLWIGVSSIILGLLVAWWIDVKWSAAVTVHAQLTFVGVDSSQQFHLFGIWWAALGLVVALVVAAGLVSMLLPLSRNLARNPIKDMRDE